MNFSKLEYQNASVIREHVISEGRRVDLVIKIADKIIPIEVKIYAGDQKNQCYDYYKFCAKSSNVFYLTLHGTEPSEYSLNGLVIYNEGVNDGVVSLLSFEKDILRWLDRCISHHETIKIAPIRELILQFRGVVRSMTNISVEEKEEEIVSVISSSKESIKSAFDIERSLKICKTDMVKRVLETIEERLDDKLKNSDNEFSNLVKLEGFSYKANNHKLVNMYYDNKKPSYPGLGYVIKSLDEEGVDLVLRFEISHLLYVGFCTPYKKEWKDKQLNLEEIKALLSVQKPRINGWWIHWEYLINDDKSKSPNFKDFNEAYFDLFDESKFDEFIDICIDNILKMLKMIK